MATVNGYTAEHTDDVFAEDIVDGFVNGSGQLVLVQRDGTQLIRQNVVGPTGPSAANPVPWSQTTAYTTGAIVGHAGALWKALANSTNKVPHLYSSIWQPIEGFDYSTQVAMNNPYFMADTIGVDWETFWKTGTSTVSLTTTAGEFETGKQALKAALAVSSSQTIYQKGENVCRGGETINIILRAKLTAAAAGATINAGIYQGDEAASPEPFATNTVLVTSVEGVQPLTTAWKTYIFTVTTVNAKSRWRPSMFLATGAGAAANILVDRMEVSRNKSLNLNPVNVPVGTVMGWTSNVIPPGWLALSGPSAPGTVSRAAYPELFALIGTTFGAGDGSTTFNLPNFVGRAPMGVYPGGPYASVIGAVGGEALHTLTIAEMPVHDHQQVVLANGVTGSGQRIDYAGDRAFAGRFDQGTQTFTNGGGAAHNVLDPYTAIIYIIRAVPSAGVDASQVQFFKGSTAGASVSFAANTNMAFGTRTDPSAAWNASTNQWVCPQPGRYRIIVQYKATAASAGRTIKILKNGTAIASMENETANGKLGGQFVDIFDLVPGDIIAIQPSAAMTSVADSLGENTFVIIETVGLTGVPATGFADTGWIALPALQNGWTQYASWEVAAYRKLNGIVYFKGLLAPGTTAAGTLMFTMPVGFRNTGPSHTPIAAGSATGGALNIYNDGRVNTNYGCTGWVSLNNISYPADN